MVNYQFGSLVRVLPETIRPLYGRRDLLLTPILNAGDAETPTLKAGALTLEAGTRTYLEPVDAASSIAGAAGISEC